MKRFIILLSLLFVTSQAKCPTKCNCTVNALNCVSQNLEYVPPLTHLHFNPSIIDLSGNEIATISEENFDFSSSDQVIEIYLNSTGLILIEEGTFRNLENLQQLYLGGNLLNDLPEQFIQSNEDIVLLDLSNNHFNSMPKIESKSLEVLAMDHCGTSEIERDALEMLPNLRFLSLAQNNLKSLSPDVFKQMGNLFFINLFYNPWKCSCSTVKLFDFIKEKNYGDLSEPVYCQNKEKLFVEIYNEHGVAPIFGEECNNVDESSESLEEVLELEEKAAEIVSALESENDSFENIIDTEYIKDYLILAVAILVSLAIGGVCGSCITFKYLMSDLRLSESRKELIGEEKVFDAL